jgi:alanine racemase
VLSLQEVAEKAGTIAYEIMARISPRVRRIYIRES